MSTRVTVLPETKMLTRTVGTAKINLSKNNMFRTKMSIKIKNQNTQQIPPTLQKFMI